METVHFKRKQNDGKPFILICDTATIWSNINNSHKSLRHTHTHIQGSLLKWNTQSLTFMGVRRYSFDRARIPKEWNHHQCSCHIMDLLLGLLADWQEGSLEEVLTWPKTFISPSLCCSDRKRRGGETKRQRPQSEEWKEADAAHELPNRTEIWRKYPLVTETEEARDEKEAWMLPQGTWKDPSSRQSPINTVLHPW